MPLSQQGLGGGATSLFRGGVVVAEPGQALFTSGGQYTWTVPAGVSEVSAVLIGGGGGGATSTNSSNGVSGGGGGGGALSWRNAISVSGGSSLYITVGSGGNGGTTAGTDNGTDGGDTYIRTGSHTGTIIARAGGGGKGKYNEGVNVTNNGGTNYSATYGGGGSVSGGGDGGRGGRGQDGHAGGGGGGAGGYSGAGGVGNNGDETSISMNAPAGGGGGGSQSQNSFTQPVIIGGGGTDLLGEGDSGTGTSGEDSSAVGGHQGSTGGPSSGQGNTVRTKNYGGGGSGAEDDSGNAAADGADGAVRIIWGEGRAFPSTNTTNGYDYSFATEVHYGNGTSGDGGTTNVHYSGDGTMPAISLGSNITNFDMYFECYMSNADFIENNNDWVICTDGYSDTNGWLLGFYNNNVNGEMSIAHPSGAYGIYSNYALPINQWNHVKIEWRGGSSFKIWQKTEGSTYTNRFSGTSNVYNGTNWNYCSIGQGRQIAGDSLDTSSQFFGKIRNFGINVESNVTDIQ